MPPVCRSPQAKQQSDQAPSHDEDGGRTGSSRLIEAMLESAEDRQAGDPHRHEDGNED